MQPPFRNDPLLRHAMKVDLPFPGQELAQHCEEIFLSIPTVDNHRLAELHSKQDHLLEGHSLVALCLFRQPPMVVQTNITDGSDHRRASQVLDPAEGLLIKLFCLWRMPTDGTVHSLGLQDLPEQGFVGLQPIWIAEVGNTSKKVGIVPRGVLP